MLALNKFIVWLFADIADLLAQERTVLTPPGSDTMSPVASPSSSMDNDSGSSNPSSPVFQDTMSGIAIVLLK